MYSHLFKKSKWSSISNIIESFLILSKLTRILSAEITNNDYSLLQIIGNPIFQVLNFLRIFLGDDKDFFRWLIKVKCSHGYVWFAFSIYRSYTH